MTNTKRIMVEPATGDDPEYFASLEEAKTWVVSVVYPRTTLDSCCYEQQQDGTYRFIGTI